MVRVCAFGTLGSGKTLSMVKEAYRYTTLHPGRPVFSNVKLDSSFFPTYRAICSPSDLFDIDESCFLGLDELWHMADSRSFNAPENKALGMLLLRSRKLEWEVFFTEQWYTQVDLRIRFVTDLWIMPQFFLGSNILQEDIYDVHANYITTRWYDGSLFFPMYRTWDDPTTLNMADLETEYERRKGFRSGANRVMLSSEVKEVVGSQLAVPFDIWAKRNQALT